MGAAREYIYYGPDGERAPATDYKGTFDVKKLSPRVKMAMRLYTTGACKTKKEASQVAGLNENYLSMLTGQKHGSSVLKTAMADLDGRLEDETLDMNVVLRTLGRAGVAKLAAIMDDPGVKPDVQLKAAQDLADRSTETSKIQRHQVSTLTIAGHDAKAMAAALVESAQARHLFAEDALHGRIEVALDTVPTIPTLEQRDHAETDQPNP